jgi:hypothetical protein
MSSGRSSAICASQYARRISRGGQQRFPEGALDLLKALKIRNDGVALLAISACLTWMESCFCSRRGKYFPRPSGRCLTAYADTNAAISAINPGESRPIFL